MQKEKMIWSWRDVPGPPGQEVLGPGTRQDLETLKVPWSRGPVVPGLNKSKDWESPGTMETLAAMAFPVVEFSRQGYTIRKVFGKKSTLFK